MARGRSMTSCCNSLRTAVQTVASRCSTSQETSLHSPHSPDIRHLVPGQGGKNFLKGFLQLTGILGFWSSGIEFIILLIACFFDVGYHAMQT